MQPYYDNYCFAKEAYGETTMYNSNMVLSFLYKYIDNGGRIPDDMLDNNILWCIGEQRWLLAKRSEKCLPCHHDREGMLIKRNNY